MREYPYTDEDMIYDYEEHRYVLTQDFVSKKMGVDLSRYKNPGSISAILRKVSDLCYEYIHIFNKAEMQDYIIAKTEGGRRLIKQAMRSQLDDILVNGLFDTAPTKEEREMWISQGAKRVIDNTEIREIGTVIIYAGCLYFRSPDMTEW